MAVNRASLVEKINSERGVEETLAPNKTVSLRLAQNGDAGEGRVHRLIDLASSLMREVQTLSRDKAFADESARLQSIDLGKGIDFYYEVQRFETALIKVALEQGAGNQAQAARLLGLRATTLNSKIKQYNIEY
jgi:DNA-binding protein Fis